jgi:hypothetical protein
MPTRTGLLITSMKRNPLFFKLDHSRYIVLPCHINMASFTFFVTCYVLYSVSGTLWQSRLPRLKTYAIVGFSDFILSIMI